MISRQSRSTTGRAYRGPDRTRPKGKKPGVICGSVPVDHDIRFPGESAEYRRERNRLLQAEIELRGTLERVAAERRALPPGGVVPEDYCRA